MIIRKNPKTDLENKRSVFLLIGFVVSLMIVIAAFEYRTYDYHRTLDFKIKETHFDQEEVEITIQKPPEVELPEIIKRAPIKVVDDNDDVKEELIIDASDNSPVEPLFLPDMIEEPEVPDDTIFENVQVQPEFPGGYSAFLKYLSNAIKYPRPALEMGISGTVYIQFILEKDGTPTDLKVLRGVAGGCTEEAVKAIENMPAWKPALQNMKPVRYKFYLPVKFTLK